MGNERMTVYGDEHTSTIYLMMVAAGQKRGIPL